LHLIAAFLLGTVERLVGALQRGVERFMRTDQRHTKAHGNRHGAYSNFSGVGT
jgi:hypothetical protein